ncbi:hypothetical protein F4678DRAFT_252571 [Xylaria arbuscula]|nr:hypothetical protein F4678DRAFT_252571 [Xylaria arbuscula]
MEQQFEDNSAWAAASHNLDFAVREYLQLQDQHQELCQRLHQLSPPSSSSSRTMTRAFTTSPSTSSSTSSLLSLASTAVTSPSVSPTRSLVGRDSLSPSPGQRMTSPTQPIRDELLGGGGGGEVAADEQKLFDVNEGMKRALTELLNCEAVRQDKAMRTWVQTRLLETEKELRRGRRRRSSATVD